MDHKNLVKEVARCSVMIYLPILVGVSLLFLLAIGMTGSYPLVAKIGTMVWVGLLSLIVSVPLVYIAGQDIERIVR